MPNCKLSQPNLLIDFGFCDVSSFVFQFDCNGPSSYVLVPSYNVHKVMIYYKTRREYNERGALSAGPLKGQFLKNPTSLIT